MTLETGNMVNQTKLEVIYHSKFSHERRTSNDTSSKFQIIHGDILLCTKFISILNRVVGFYMVKNQRNRFKLSRIFNYIIYCYISCHVCTLILY